MHNREKEALAVADRRMRLMDVAYHMFLSSSIDQVSLDTIAKESGVGIATLYRYFGSKPELVIAINVWQWGIYLQEIAQRLDEFNRGDPNGREGLIFFLDCFLDMYHNRRGLLRFNQMFNTYVNGAGASTEQIQPFSALIDTMAERFRLVWETGEQDGTLRTDTPWEHAFTTIIHIMLATTTRYAVGLVYRPADGADPEEELLLLRDMLVQRFTN